MFETVEELSEKLSEIGYFIDPTMTKVVFLAARMQKPLLLEAPAGSGKTQLALAVAQAAGTVVTNGDGSGGVLFNTFPQEFCDLLAENTGGRKVRVRMPRLPEGHILVEDGKMISVYPFRNEDGSTGEHRALIAGYTGKPELDFSNSVLHQ